MLRKSGAWSVKKVFNNFVRSAKLKSRSGAAALAVSKGRAFGRANERSSFFAVARNSPYEGASAKGVNKTTQASFPLKAARGERFCKNKLRLFESVPLGISGYCNLNLAKQPGELFCNKEQSVFKQPYFFDNSIVKITFNNIIITFFSWSARRSFSSCACAFASQEYIP